MLNSENTLFALNDIKDEHLESARALLGYKVEEAPRHIARKRIITFALAAALILGLGTAAYAAGLFGIRALFIKDSALADIPDSGLLSLTQPQEVPEEMDAEIRRKIDNSTEAWAEWDTWRKSNGIFQPDVFVWPDDCVCDGCEDNGDGTWTVIFYAPISASYDEDGNLLGYYDGFREIERRTATQAEYDQNETYKQAVLNNPPLYGYDYNYQILSQEMAEKLESIAASRGLKLRKARKVVYQNYGAFTQYASREEITAKINEVCAGGGRLFRTEPAAYEKFYYFNEGTFAVNFFLTGDAENGGTSCYLYCSPYGTLSSGFEIYDEVKDAEAFSVRSHTTPDGTELTVMQKDEDMYAYVYLDNAFVTLHIRQPELSDDEINVALDMVDFSAIA